MKLSRLFFFGMLACSITLPLASCGDDDEPDIEKPSDTTIHLPDAIPSQVGGYTVKGEKVTMIVTNVRARQGNRYLTPTSYSIITANSVISATASAVSGNPDVAMLEFDSSSLPTGYVDCIINIHYSFDGGNVGVTAQSRLGIISATPKFALAWQPIAWGGYDDVRTDPDGATHIHNEPDKTINPVWTEPASLVLNMGEKFTLPDSAGLNFHSDVTLIAAVDTKASNLSWQMSDVKWLYDGMEFPGKFSFAFGSDENPRSLSATLIYTVKGEMDGVAIEETQRRPIQIDIKR